MANKQFLETVIMNNELWQKPALTHVPPAWETYTLPTELFWRCLLEVVFIFNLQYVSHWLTHTLLLGTLCRLILCSSEHFDPQHILIPGTLCFLTHFAPQNTLLLGTLCWLILCSSEHFDPQHILVPGTLCSPAHFVSWNALLLGTLCSLEPFAHL